MKVKAIIKVMKLKEWKEQQSRREQRHMTDKDQDVKSFFFNDVMAKTDYIYLLKRH
jgi:hypothetical protein